MNVVSGGRNGSKIRRFVLAAVALLTAIFLAVAVSSEAFAKANGYGISTSFSVESEIDSIPGSSAGSDADSFLEGPLMASDPIFDATDSLKGPLTDLGTDTPTDTTLQGPLG